MTTQTNSVDALAALKNMDVSALQQQGSILFESLKAWLLAYGLKIVGAVVVLVVGRIVARWLRSLIVKSLERGNVEAALISFAGSLCYMGLMSFVIIAALGVLDIPTASFVTVVGAAGLAIGLALQGSLSNFAAGVLMLIFKPFKVGDFIEGGGVLGTVEGVEVFTSKLKTPDNRAIIVPNAKIMGDNIINYTMKDSRRIDLVAGCGYGDDLSKVREVLTKILEEDARVLDEPAAKIAVSELGESSVDFIVRPWVKTEDYWDTRFDITEKIKRRFDEEGISIPFPQRDIHIFKEE